jgi:hypothetical protein
MAKPKKSKAPPSALEILTPRESLLPGAPSRFTFEPGVKSQSLWSPSEAPFEIKPVDQDAMAADWKEKLGRIVDIATSAAQTQDKAWHIDEIEIGLTLSAEGKLLFIAKAGAEASVKVTLKKS